jgi:hypothetical protein
MRTREELFKIKEAFSFSVLDLLDVFDELLATGRVYVHDESDDEPTFNDLVKNEEESIIIIEDTDTNRGDTYVR